MAQALPPQVYGEPASVLNYAGQDATLIGVVGNDLASSQAECVLGTGQAGVPAGSTNFGFADTTYLPTTSQILAETTVGVS